MTRLDVRAGDPVSLSDERLTIDGVHCFDQSDIDAINAALSSKRPLLVRGEPGVGKTQMALAAAISMKRAYCQMVVDSRTEVRDLRWSEDLVARLADAQLVSALGDLTHAKQLRTKIANISNYVVPGPLWWAFDWGNAAKTLAASNGVDDASLVWPAQPSPSCDPSNGVVVLIDEIDKADSELPNGLLEALGSRQFTPRGSSVPVSASVWPLIIITTNGERVLPNAFLRRCVVHDVRLPDNDEQLIEFLIARGMAHFGDTHIDILIDAAKLTVADRAMTKNRRLTPLPGQAEFLDLLRAVIAENPELAGQQAMIKRISPYFLRKHSELRAETR
jgi:MoxR-like ATPase